MALTRARDHLLLSGEGPASADSWRGHLEAAAARRPDLVRRIPIEEAGAPTPTSTSTSTEGASVQPPLPSGERAGERGEAPSERPLRRPNVPADVERAVRLRDGERCQYPLADGGVCGSTWQVELDHQALLAFGGEATVANLRCLCRPHNARAAREALGEAAFRILARPPRRR